MNQPPDDLEYLTVQEIAHLTGWTVGYVRRLASRDAWRRRRPGSDRRVALYHWSDVADTRERNT